jgi:hypothetical protein
MLLVYMQTHHQMALLQESETQFRVWIGETEQGK